MTISNKLQKIVDRPVWEWCRFNPIGNTAAGSALCTADDGSGRYMYYLQASAFYRYDTWTDSWQLLAPPLVTGGTVSTALKYSLYGGWRGRVLAASNTPATLTVPGLQNNLLAEKTDNTAVKVRIMSGTGAGQEKTVLSTAANVIADHGVATGGSTATVIDSTKLWKFNQWRGYQVRITLGSGLSQVRKILYNDQTTLTVAATNHQSIEPWGNALFTVAVAAASMYQIESTVVTMTDATWTTLPDITSTFAFMTGGIWYITTAGTPGWSHMAYYDIHSDMWIPKTTMMGNLTAALGTDWSIERTGEVGGMYVGPVAAVNAGSNTTRTFTDTTASWTVDQWVGYQLRITVGTAAGQRRRIIGNTGTVLTVQRPFDVTPGQTDTYSILGDTDKIYLTGNASSSMYQYSIENDLWSPGIPFDWGTARIGSVQLKAASSATGNESIGLTSIVYNATGMLTAAVTTAGTGYTRASVGTIVAVANTTGGTVMITGVTAAGGVASVEIVNSGTGGTAGSQIIGGGSAAVTITVGKVGLVTTAIIHNLKTGDPILIAGAETDTNWNGATTILGVSSTTVFSMAPANGAAAASATFTAQSATLLRDPIQNWLPNEHIGKMVMTYHTPTAPGIYTLQAISAMRITSNTATALTVPALTNAPTNGLTRYVIFSPEALGREEQYKIAGQKGDGYATAGGATSLTDSTKAWLLNQWVGYTVRIIAGTGIANGEQAITASNATSITVASWASATPDSTSKYIIKDTFGNVTSAPSTTVVTDATKNWVAGSLVGKRARIMGGVNCGLEVPITANTATTWTTSTTMTISTTDMSYSILSSPVRASGISLQWAYNPSKQQKGKYLIAPRGNTPYFDIYDITRNTWDIQTLYTPQTEILVAGTMYAYDGADRLYFTVGATGRVLYLDVSTGMIMGSSQTPYAHGVALVGNRMEIVKTIDGLVYLYIMRHTGAEMWRTLAFWNAW